MQETDRRFSEIVRWAFYAMVMAEEYGLTMKNVDDMARSDSPAIKRFLGVTPGLGKMPGLDDKWASSIVRQVGNYGEVYERNVGSGSQLKIPRALNTQWNVGGMQYAPPFR